MSILARVARCECDAAFGGKFDFKWNPYKRTAFGGGESSAAEDMKLFAAVFAIVVAFAAALNETDLYTTPGQKPPEQTLYPKQG
ncbi:unnamed protein product [Caenorhabditis auriculariae]|uniref:Uncharacterized protein n=1 Tax=Caenorhabditis auriculariae TaxID=2777116 RepID=A0A8S1HGN8_9PELO|nr:unnamed protein product [Caenorhabditis auriculariae]